jgi:hypothetical protein
LLIEGEELILKVYAYVDEWNGNLQSAEVYDLIPSLELPEQTATDRFSSDEGDKIFMMTYEQRYN